MSVPTEVKRIPRILLSAAASGSGKTLITCGLMNLFKRRGMCVASYKCGPDYIDPMFHRTVIGTRSQNLDAFFTDPDTMRSLFAAGAAEAELAVIEGVMGYYDGVAGTTTRASAYDVARITQTPAILLVDARGASVSIAAVVEGFAKFQADSQIRGVILNRLSPMMYGRMKKLIEERTGVSVLGYVPVVKDCTLESRHLGLLLPEEVSDLKEKLNTLSDVLEETLDVAGILELAGSAETLEVASVQQDAEDKHAVMVQRDAEDTQVTTVQCEHARKKVKIGVAKDEAFCFIYRENLELLEKLGAELVAFSPMEDAHLPEGLDGVLLYGGYPELHARALSENVGMREELRAAILGGLPTIAECGGFMYLNTEMEDLDGKSWPMVDVIAGASGNKGRLKRFGYVTLTGLSVFGCAVGDVPAHEFHYYDSTNCGEACVAKKPESTRSWSCMHSTPTLLAGYPHIYYYGNPEVAKSFMRACEAYHAHAGQGGQRG